MIAMDNLNGERRRQGRIEVICGSMFSGKTEELIRRLKRAKFAKQRVEIFKPLYRHALFGRGCREPRPECNPVNTHRLVGQYSSACVQH